jgi:hypothetical protein
MNIEILNWPGPPGKGDYGGVKRIRGDEPVGVVIHICMEISHGNSLYSYPYLFFFYLFSPTKSENRRAKQVLQKRRGLASVGGRSNSERW